MGHKGHVSKPSRELSKIDWRDADHKRIITSSLIEKVYAEERVRQGNGQESVAASQSWVSKHFEVIERLIDKEGSSIFGLVYKLKPPPPTAAENAPTYVIALRGTLFRVMKDIRQDGRITIGTLHRSSRFELAKKVVWEALSAAASADGDGGCPSQSRTTIAVWLTGHSLGASLATLVGKSMAKMGVFLQTFLFNPPFPSCPISKIRPKRLGRKFRIADSFFKAWLAADAVNSRRSRMNGNKRPFKSDEEEEKECFANLGKWAPHLFLNPKDWICSEYTPYFQHRETMKEIGAGQIEKVASQQSKRASIMSALFDKDSDPFHLLPTAFLTINRNPSGAILQDHALQQWWQPDLQMDCEAYLYDDLSQD